MAKDDPRLMEFKKELKRLRVASATWNLRNVHKALSDATAHLDRDWEVADFWGHLDGKPPSQ